MAKMKFKLKAMRSLTVRALNGKLYALKAGMNQLELEYRDYVALLKALGMKPLPEQKEELPEVKSEPVKSEEAPNTAEPAKEEPKIEEAPAEEPQYEDTPKVEEQADSKIEEPVNEMPAESAPAIDASVEDDASKAEETSADEPAKEVDYLSMSYSQLKAEYKRVTGKSCKLKKDEIIQFLQENDNA